MPPSSWWWPHCRVRYCWSCDASRYTCSYSPPVLRPPLIGGPQGRVACGLAEGRIPARRLTERRSLRLPRRADCAFPSRRRPGGAERNPPPDCGALWKMAKLGKCAPTPPRQAGGGLRRGPLTIPGEVGVSRQSGSARQVAGPPCPPARTRHAPRSRRRTRRPRGRLA